MKTTEHNPTLRVLNILETLASNPEGLTLTEIAEIINSPKSTILPIIHTMANKKFIFFNEKTYTYTIGINSFCIGSSYIGNMNALQFIKSEMEYVVKKTDEICQMGILEGGDVLYVAKVDSTNPIRITSSVGKKLPAYCTALGKAMLFNYTEEELIKFYPTGLKAYTKNTITDFKVLLEQLKNIQKTYISTEYGEANEELSCISVPLMNGDNIIAAISVSAPSFRFNNEKNKLIIKYLLDAKSKIELYFKEHDINNSQLMLNK